MSALDALKRAREAGIRIRVDGDILRLVAKAAPPPGVVEMLERHKADVVALVRSGSGPNALSDEDWKVFFDERAAIAEFDGGLPRDQAEAQAFEACVTEWLTRNGVQAPPDRGRHAVHLRCLVAWHAARRAEAVAVLSLLGISAP